MRGKSILLIGLLFTATTFAQGTFLYTWHGNSSLFQASFQVTEEENQPGQYFESQTFYNSIRFVSPDDTFTYTYFFGPGLHDGANGQAEPLSLQFFLFDNSLNRELAAGANSTFGIIHEFDTQSQSLLWADSGYWTATYIPEPSVSALLVLASTVWPLLRRTGLNKPAPRR